MKKRVIIFSIVLLIIPLIIGIAVFINPFAFFGGPWQTQEVIFVKKTDPQIQIEFQMQDMGAFGYNRRIVKVEKGTLWETTYSFDTTGIDTTQWKKVEIFVNELGLKIP